MSTRRRKRPDSPSPSRGLLPPTGHYINRELSWLEFNWRVLEEARRRDNPLLERLKFLSIVSSNLDEFYMVRVGGLRQLARAGIRKRCPAGLTPAEQLLAIATRVHGMVATQYDCLRDELLPALAHEGIARVRLASLTGRAGATIEKYFDEEIFPALTPVAVEEGGAFPRVAGLVMHLAIRLRPESARGKKVEERLAILALPRTWPRFVPVGAYGGYRYVLVEDIVRRYAARFFPGHTVREAVAFRVTRNADLEVHHEDVVDLLEAMEGILRARKEGTPVRLEIEAGASAGLLDRLCQVFAIDRESELFAIDGPLDLKPFMKLASQTPARGLRYEAFTPQPVAAFAGGEESCWDVVRERDVLVHLPYESFEPVVDMVKSAADDPQVTAIKQTLYRTSEDSPIIGALERAARKGKQVSVLVELKARFDEERNIDWARRLSDAGAQVVYGVMALKTHAKLLLIVRREADGVRRYVHLSTGNYHDETARLYEDVGLFTSDPAIGADAAHVFNAITGYSAPVAWQKLAVAPTGLRERLSELVEREISRSSPDAPGEILLKMNSLVDKDVISQLYRASEAGVKIRACVRGICCLRPGVPGLSSNIQVVSIVDRYLEHSRIAYFRNGGEEEVYLSSADWMPRNLDRRVEILFPVTDEANRARLVHVLHTVFEDNQRAWRLLPDGSYERVRPRRGEPQRRTQRTFQAEALERGDALRRAKLVVFRPVGPGTAPGT